MSYLNVTEPQTITYRVEYDYQPEGESRMRYVTTVAISSGYSDLGDIPRIIATNEWGGPGLARFVRVRHLTFLNARPVELAHKPKAQGPVYTLEQLSDRFGPNAIGKSGVSWPGHSRWQQVYGDPSENVHLA